jgi:hypothetical protein
MNARIRTAAAMPRDTEITVQCKSPLHGKWQPAETLTLEAWMHRAGSTASAGVLFCTEPAQIHAGARDPIEGPRPEPETRDSGRLCLRAGCPAR